MPENVPTADQIRAYLLANGWQMGESGRAAYLMVSMGHTIRMLHEPTEYDLGKAVFEISLAEGRHPADVRQDILNGAAALPDEQQPAEATGGEQAQDGALERLRVYSEDPLWSAKLRADLRAVLAERDALAARVAELEAEREADTRAVAALLKLGDVSFRGTLLTDWEDAKGALAARFADRIAALNDDADGGAE